MLAIRRLFLRLLGLVYLVAFASLGVQIAGLIGSRGILPVGELLGWAEQQVGPARFWLLPTLLWLGSSDAALQALCWGGALLAVLLILDVAPALVLALLWTGYLSLASVGQVFLGYQWDALLLETGLLAILVAPLRLGRRAERDAEPSRLAVFLVRFLLFRLMFSSGAVKLLSGDPSWRTLAALRVHYETQPIPAWTSWFAHQLPPSFQSFSCLAMFVCELAVPFLALGSRRARLWGFFPLVGLQLLIAATGNYAFFNWLTIALCVLLLDDAALPQRLFPAPSAPGPGRTWPRSVLWPAAGLYLLLSLGHLAFTFGIAPPAPVLGLMRLAAPFDAVNSYGLFAVMTTTRPEIIVEGSEDGVNWLDYEFKWKPGDVNRAPAFVAPHQPRLDWQMWFAALGVCESNPWFVRFLERLREGSPPVLELLARDPFPSRPPRYLRSVVYDYRFTRAGAEAWWRRERQGPYCPELGPGPESP